MLMLLLCQAICTPDDRYDAYRRSSDFIREHIFSGGHLPCVGAMVDAAVGTGLSLSGLKDIGPHYATTLRAWRQAWEAKKADALALGYDATFWRKYRQDPLPQSLPSTPSCSIHHNFHHSEQQCGMEAYKPVAFP